MKKISKEVTVVKEVNIVTFKDFVDFLKAEGALSEFVQETLRLRTDFDPVRPLQNYWERTAKNHLESGMFLSSFSWCNSHKGHMYWYNLNGRFADWCKSQDIQDVDIEDFNY